jgi:hypothetical protein
MNTNQPHDFNDANMIKDKFTRLKVSRQRKYQLCMLQQRRCTICGEAAVTRSHCLRHAIMTRETSRARMSFRERYLGAHTYQIQAA